METKHTPGPYTIGRFLEGDYSIQQGDGGDTLAEGIKKYEDAKLLAAAPELLEALKEAKEELRFLYAQKQNEKFWSADAEVKFSKIRTAIKKATI